MTENLVRLSEDEHVFRVEGNSSVSFTKLDHMIIMQHPLRGVIPRANVKGLVIDETTSPPGLYLDWRRGNLPEHTYLGGINDLNFAQNFVSRVNDYLREGQ